MGLSHPRERIMRCHGTKREEIKSLVKEDKKLEKPEKGGRKPAPGWSQVSCMRAGCAEVFVWPSSMFVTSSSKMCVLKWHDVDDMYLYVAQVACILFCLQSCPSLVPYCSSSPCRGSCSEPQRTPLSVELGSLSLFNMLASVFLALWGFAVLHFMFVCHLWCMFWWLPKSFIVAISSCSLALAELCPSSISSLVFFKPFPVFPTVSRGVFPAISSVSQWFSQLYLASPSLPFSLSFVLKVFSHVAVIFLHLSWVPCTLICIICAINPSSVHACAVVKWHVLLDTPFSLVQNFTVS